LTVHLKEQETPFILEVGNTTPAGFSVYARRKGEEKILLAPETVKTSFEKDVFAFRSKVPLSFAQEAVQAVSLRTDSLRIRLERHEQGKWRMTEPIEVAADSGKVSALLQSLTQDQIVAIPEKPPASRKTLGLDPPRGEIRRAWIRLEGRSGWPLPGKPRPPSSSEQRRKREKTRKKKESTLGEVGRSTSSCSRKSS
jgi:hypothetical protein